jgi:hypothetical protein
MSNNSTAFAPAHTMSAPAAKPAHGVWQRLYQAWLDAYGTRIDSNGNIMCEL